MAKAKSYKGLSDELSEVMDSLEGGELDIDQAVECYERGLAIVRELEEHLRQAENKVTKLRNNLLDDEEE